MKSIYVSEMDLSENIIRPYDNARVLKLKSLLENYFQLIYTKDGNFDSYDLIYKRIDTTNAFIAIYDEYWTSSTWRVSELTHSARFDILTQDNKEMLKNLPVFVYQANPEYKIYDWIKSQIKILPVDVNKAVQMILNHFG